MITLVRKSIAYYKVCKVIARYNYYECNRSYIVLFLAQLLGSIKELFSNTSIVSAW